MQVRLLAAGADARLGTGRREARIVTTDEHGVPVRQAQAGNYLVRKQPSDREHRRQVASPDRQPAAANFAHPPRGASWVQSSMTSTATVGETQAAGAGRCPHRAPSRQNRRPGEQTGAWQRSTSSNAPTCSPSNLGITWCRVSSGRIRLSQWQLRSVTLQGSALQPTWRAAKGPYGAACSTTWMATATRGVGPVWLAPRWAGGLQTDQTCGTDDDTVVATELHDEGRCNFHGVGPGRYLIRLTGGPGSAPGRLAPIR